MTLGLPSHLVTDEAKCQEAAIFRAIKYIVYYRPLLIYVTTEGER